MKKKKRNVFCLLPFKEEVRCHKRVPHEIPDVYLNLAFLCLLISEKSVSFVYNL